MTLRACDLIESEVVTVAPDARLLDVLHLVVEAHVGSVPVVDARGAVRGIITRADLLRVVDQAFDDDVDPVEPGAVGAGLGTLTAVDIATPEPIWVSPDTSAAESAQVMRERGVHRVLVGSDGRLAGVLSAFDLLERGSGASRKSMALRTATAILLFAATCLFSLFGWSAKARRAERSRAPRAGSAPTRRGRPRDPGCEWC